MLTDKLEAKLPEETFYGVPVERKIVPCSFGGHGQAVAGFEFSNGCAALPDVHHQDLCLQHIVKAEPIGQMDLVVVYEPEALDQLNVAATKNRPPGS